MSLFFGKCVHPQDTVTIVFRSTPVQLNSLKVGNVTTFEMLFHVAETIDKFKKKKKTKTRQDFPTASDINYTCILLLKL